MTPSRSHDVVADSTPLRWLLEPERVDGGVLRGVFERDPKGARAPIGRITVPADLDDSATHARRATLTVRLAPTPAMCGRSVVVEA